MVRPGLVRFILLKHFTGEARPCRDFPAFSPNCRPNVAAGRFNNPAANEAFYNSTQTYNLPVMYPKVAATVEDVGKLAPEAGYLLTAAFPTLTLEQANRIFTETEGPGGGFLNDGSSFGVYSRLNLYAAVKRAAQVVASNTESAQKQ
jgi:hypothetical protein